MHWYEYVLMLSLSVEWDKYIVNCMQVHNHHKCSTDEDYIVTYKSILLMISEMTEGGAFSFSVKVVFILEG